MLILEKFPANSSNCTNVQIWQSGNVLHFLADVVSIKDDFEIAIASIVIINVVFADLCVAQTPFRRDKNMSFTVL